MVTLAPLGTKLATKPGTKLGTKPSTRDGVTLEALGRLYFRVETPHGARSVSALDASSADFDTWARTLARVDGPPAPWSLGERSAFVAWCMSHGHRFVFAAPVDPVEEAESTALHIDRVASVALPKALPKTG